MRARAGSGGQASDFGPVFEDTKNRVRELETRNFLLTEKFNALRSQYHQMMILMHTFFADTAAIEKEAGGGWVVLPLPVAPIIPIREPFLRLRLMLLRINGSD